MCSLRLLRLHSAGFIGNSYLAAGGVAFRSVPHMGHFCAVPPGRMLFAIFEFVKGSFVVSFNSSYVSLLCGSWPHARIQKTVADEGTWYSRHRQVILPEG